MAKHCRRYYWLSDIELDETIDSAHVCLGRYKTIAQQLKQIHLPAPQELTNQSSHLTVHQKRK